MGLVKLPNTSPYEKRGAVALFSRVLDIHLFGGICSEYNITYSISSNLMPTMRHTLWNYSNIANFYWL